MTKQELKYLVDIQLFIEELETFFSEEKRFEDFDNYVVVRRAAALGNFNKPCTTIKS